VYVLLTGVINPKTQHNWRSTPNSFALNGWSGCFSLAFTLAELFEKAMNVKFGHLPTPGI
jgi:hypothetical protein